ncbi:MAG: nitrilase-related carbon-nitrogen hydrolase [Fimbriimonadaceae bacterium]
MTVSAVAWEIRPATSVEDFLDHLHELLGAARADLIVLPELPVLELLGMHPGIKEVDVPVVLESYAGIYEDALQGFAKDHDCIVVGGSHIRNRRNVCLVAEPDRSWFQPKNVLTQWESQEWNLDRSTGLRLSTSGQIGVTVCYDSEFPASGRNLAEAGVLIQCVPAYTETRHGFQRVRWCAQVRAIENQIITVHASLVGSLGAEPVPSTYGSSAILTPSIAPFPETAILAETALNQEGIARAEVDLNSILDARLTGDVRNWHDRDSSDWKLL